MRLTRLETGVTAPRGFRAAGVSCGIKKSGDLDLAMIVSDKPAAVAGVFTTNQAAAAPVKICRNRIGMGTSSGVVVNSGCANACTGEQGDLDAIAMAGAAAGSLGLDEDQILVCSTGLIGSLLPMDKVQSGIDAAAKALGSSDDSAARAIMTTDTRPKRSALMHAAGWRIGGIAKGAGMIAPDLATMLAFVTTDARVQSRALQILLEEVVGTTFNAITIDGDASTNDTVLAFANGASGLVPDMEDFAEAFDRVCRSLAEMIVADGEGATKFVRVRVQGAESADHARQAARAVAESTLVKTALYGQDANWGRIVAALGRSGAKADYDGISVAIAGVTVYERGTPAGMKAISEARFALRDPEIQIVCDLHAGEAAAEMLTTDLSQEYVAVNASYES